MMTLDLVKVCLFLSGGLFHFAFSLNMSWVTVA